jgi:hypothetical protein
MANLNRCEVNLKSLLYQLRSGRKNVNVKEGTASSVGDVLGFSATEENSACELFARLVTGLVIGAYAEQSRLCFGMLAQLVHFIPGDFASAFRFFLFALSSTLGLVTLLLLPRLFFLALIEC